MGSTYKARQAYEYDFDTKQIAGRFYFIIGGEMADGTKCWFKCDKDGEIENNDTWYIMQRTCGHMIATAQ